MGEANNISFDISGDDVVEVRASPAIGVTDAERQLLVQQQVHEGLGGAVLGVKGLAAGGALGAFAVRRIATPFLWAGGAVCAAGWFGAFEAALSVTKIACPVPAKPDERAQMLGVATVPVTGGAILWAGWQLAPAYANPAEAGLMAFAKSLPLRHAAMVGAASATASAVCCRVVQHRNGA